MGTGCFFLAFTYLENRLFVAENGVKILNKFGKESALEKVDIFRAMIGAICKEILFGGMSMKVKVELDSLEVFLSDLKSQLMKTCNLGEDKAIKILELPIEIFSGVRSSIVSYDNTVNIDHGDDVKDKHLSEYLMFVIFFEQLPDDSFHYIRRMGLSWMNSGRKYNCLFGGLYWGIC